MAEEGRREIKITGVAADAYHKSKGGRKTRRTAQTGGEGEPPEPALPVRTVNAKPFMNAIKIGGDTKVIAAPAAAPVKKEVEKPQEVKPVPAPQIPKGRLILSPAKTKTKKVLLAAPVNKQILKKGETRKIRVQLSGLKKRMTKAKTIHHDSRHKPIAEVRKLLEEAKLVKPDVTGKVPENVLRDIYKDYLLLRNRAL